MSASRKTPGATNALLRFFYSVSRHVAEEGGLLTFKEQLELGRLKNIKTKRGKRSRKSQAAFDELVVRNLRLAIGMAIRYQGCGVQPGDLIQAGCRGLMTAAEKYDPERKITFSTYAPWWIRQCILREIWSQRSEVRSGYNHEQMLLKMDRARHGYHVLHGHYPTRDETARFIGLNPRRLDSLMRCCFTTISIVREGEPVSDIAVRESHIMSTSFPDPSLELDRRAIHRLLDEVFAESAFKSAHEDEAARARKMRNLAIVREVAVGQATLKSIGQRYGITRERVRQVYRRELPKLRRLLEARNITMDDLSTV